jgi:hypothetical protein
MNDRPDDIIKPTRERMRKAIGYDEVVETTPGGLTRKNGAVRLTNAVWDIYKKGRINDEQLSAAERYYLDWYIGFGSTEQVTMRWQEYIGGGHSPSGNLDAGERRVFHQKRYAEANKLLEKMDWRKPVHWLVITDRTAEEVGKLHYRYRGKHSGSAAAVTGLRDALQSLAIFYGLAK